MLLVTGTLRASCLYADEERAACSCATSDCRLRSSWRAPGCVKAADARALLRPQRGRLPDNSRKVLLRVTVLVQADGYEPQTQSMSVLMIRPLPAAENADRRDECAGGASSARFRSAELESADGRPQIARLVSCSAHAGRAGAGAVGEQGRPAEPQICRLPIWTAKTRCGR